MSDPSRLKATVFVGGLPPNTTPQTLHATFIPFGDIVDVTIPKPDNARRRQENHATPHGNDSNKQPTSRGGAAADSDTTRGFGYVEFESAADAREAIDNMDQAELFGRVIRVAEAKPQKDGSAIGSGMGEGLGSRTALWLQEGYLAEHAVDEEDRRAAREAQEREMAGARGDGGDGEDGRVDPMQGLEGLDVAGPKDA